MSEQKFNADDWKRRFKGNSDESFSNSMMDSGWSKGIADRCARAATTLWRELVVAIAAPDADISKIQEVARYAIKGDE